MINLESYPEPNVSLGSLEAVSEKVIVGAVSKFPSPLSLAKTANSDWWVVVSDAYINYAELWVFNNTGALLNRINLSDHAIPLDIVQVGKRMLVADHEENQVYAIDTSTLKRTIFGDDKFQSILQKTREQRNQYRGMKDVSFKFLGVLLLAVTSVFFINWQMIRKKKGE